MLALSEVEHRLGICFSNKHLLIEALTHPSVQGDSSYQRLEFLGDAVVDLYAAEALFQLFPADDEGALAKKRAALVSRDSLAEAARQCGLQDVFVLSVGEEGTGGRDNPKNLEDVFEAFVGALYLDAGYGSAVAFLSETLQAKAASMSQAPQDPKTALQEFSQGHKKGLPVYVTEKISGASHAPVFRSEVTLLSGESAVAEGASKKTAERSAAALLLETLRL